MTKNVHPIRPREPEPASLGDALAALAEALHRLAEALAKVGTP
jgi:hypothetical protein